MVYSKNFYAKGKWVTGTLSKSEEDKTELKSYEVHEDLMKFCLDSANSIAGDFFGDNCSDEVVAMIAIALFEKEASHTVHFKDEVIKNAIFRSRAFRKNKM